MHLDRNVSLNHAESYLERFKLFYLKKKTRNSLHLTEEWLWNDQVIRTSKITFFFYRNNKPSTKSTKIIKIMYFHKIFNEIRHCIYKIKTKLMIFILLNLNSPATAPVALIGSVNFILCVRTSCDLKLECNYFVLTNFKLL